MCDGNEDSGENTIPKKEAIDAIPKEGCHTHSPIAGNKLSFGVLPRGGDYEVTIPSDSSHGKQKCEAMNLVDNNTNKVVSVSQNMSPIVQVLDMRF
jgi:hypothetical protein